MQALVMRAFEGPDALDVAEVPEPEATGKVVIAVAGAGLGFADVLITRGLYQVRPNLPFVPGMEVVGVVRRTVPGSGIDIGTRVTALTGVGGGCAELAAVPPQFVFPVPDSLDVAAAASLVVNFHTAYFALQRRAQIQPGQTVLVQGAGGGLGQATVQVAKALGGRVIGIASSPAKQHAARLAGADEVLAPDDGWPAEVRARSASRGVDVVIDPVGGERFDDNIRVLAPEGRVVVVGFAAGQIPTVKVNRLLLRNVSIVGAAWREFVSDMPEFGQRTGRALYRMIEEGRINPTAGSVFPLHRGADAMRALDEQRIVGRAVVVL
jgi:NADPH:quinone reductase